MDETKPEHGRTPDAASDREPNHKAHQGHEAHEETEDDEFDLDPEQYACDYGVAQRTSPLSPECEELMRRVIGAAIAVHKSLGPGFLESIYRKAMCIELDCRGIAYEVERPVTVRYRGKEITGQRVDLIVERQLVLELKTVKAFDDVHVAQVISYLRTTGLRGGLLVNFRVTLLKHGLRRIVL